MRYAVILAGGSGRRFWPASRRHLPKQFLKTLGKRSFFEETIARAEKIISSNNIFIITNALYLTEIKNQLKKSRIPAENIILEPSPRNTLPAIGLCAKLLSQSDPQANLLVMPADHYVRGDAQFKSAMARAQRAADKGFLCLIGVRPDRPCQGYGYINCVKAQMKGIFKVDSFIEKPSAGLAKRLFRKRGVYWNAGIFCFKAAVLLGETKRYQPGLYKQIKKIGKIHDVYRVWPKIKSVSIDYGLLEKSKKLVMLPAKFYWRDLGSWEALAEISPKDKFNNVLAPGTVDLGSKDIFVYSQDRCRVIATIGLNGLIIADTPEALLVCRKGESEKIKCLVDILKRKRKTCV